MTLYHIFESVYLFSMQHSIDRLDVRNLTHWMKMKSDNNMRDCQHLSKSLVGWCDSSLIRAFNWFSSICRGRPDTEILRDQNFDPWKGKTMLNCIYISVKVRLKLLDNKIMNRLFAVNL